MAKEEVSELKSSVEGVEQEAMAAMLLTLMGDHPLPWRIEHDWSPEIYDAKSERFLTPSTTAAAEYIVVLAIGFDKELEAIDKESQAIADETDFVSGPVEWVS